MGFNGENGVKCIINTNWLEIDSNKAQIRDSVECSVEFSNCREELVRNWVKIGEKLRRNSGNSARHVRTECALKGKSLSRGNRAAHAGLQAKRAGR